MITISRATGSKEKTQFVPEKGSNKLLQLWKYGWKTLKGIWKGAQTPGELRRTIWEGVIFYRNIRRERESYVSHWGP